MLANRKRNSPWFFLWLYATAITIAVPAAVFATDDLQEVHSSAGRRESCLRKPPLTVYYEQLVDLIIGSTPLEQGDRWVRHHIDSSGVLFDVDADGHFSNWKMGRLSGSIARDFWTLYAVASCPPTKPPVGVTTPSTMIMDNCRIAMVSSQEAEGWRVDQGYGISRRIGAENIYFSLIPASFIRSFPGVVGLAQVTALENLVGIPVCRLCPTGEKYWNMDSANKLIKNDNQISQFLGEWSKFFKSKPQPSRDEIIDFANGLKVKYKTLLKQGEPEAPFP